MPSRQVQDLVKQPGGHAVQMSTTLREAALQLLVSDCDLLAVTHADGRLAGVITESAVVRALLSNPPSAQTVAPWVTAHVDSVRQTADLNSVLHLFRASCHTAVPVVDENSCVCGLLLRRDVMGEMLQASNPAAAAASTEVQQRIDPPQAGEVASGPVGAAPLPVASNGEASVLSPLPQDESEPAQADPAQPASAPLGTESPGGVSRKVESGSNDGRQQRPHFLTGQEARRRLGTLSDFRGGFNELPW